MTRSAPRAVGIALAGIVGVWLIVGALRQPGLPQFRPSGDPRPLPVAGVLSSASLAEFEGVLVGQRGLPVVVNVWASWCAPCRTEMPLLQRASRAYAGRAVIVGVASRDDPDAAQAFLDRFGLSFPNVFDPTGEIRVRLGLTAFPTTYVFGIDGRLRSRVAGGISEQRLAALIEDAAR